MRLLGLLWQRVAVGVKSGWAGVCPKFLGRRCLNQDLQDLEIFRITGERVVAVKGILLRREKGQIAEGQ